MWPARSDRGTHTAVCESDSARAAEKRGREINRPISGRAITDTPRAHSTLPLYGIHILRPWLMQGAKTRCPRWRRAVRWSRPLAGARAQGLGRLRTLTPLARALAT